MNLTDYFNRYFEILPADTSDLVEEVLRLRYQVYCVETTILRGSHHTNCREKDLYDPRSVHHLIRHKPTGLFVATVRLILPDPSNLETRFPMEEFCSQCFYKDLDALEEVSRGSLAEVSRFLISKSREREIITSQMSKEGQDEGASGYRRKDGLLCYLLLFGLFSAVVRMTALNRIMYWYVGVEPSFHRLLSRFGIEFTPIGPLFEYHGPRLPCLGSTVSILKGIQRYRPEIWTFLTEGGKLTLSPPSEQTTRFS